MENVSHKNVKYPVSHTEAEVLVGNTWFLVLRTRHLLHNPQFLIKKNNKWKYRYDIKII